MIDIIYRGLIVLLLAAALLISLSALFIKLNNPLLEAFGFRQTQTAITSYYLMRGGSLLAYETPVLGLPWSIPFEFPLYQAIVAIFAALFGHLDAAGRITSYVFFILCLYPVHRLFRLYHAPPAAFFIAAVLMLASPLYVLYRRTFLIETTALFFALMWLWLFAEQLKVGALVLGA